MIIINESPNLAEIVKNRVKLDGIDIFSTRGLLFNYSYKNKKLVVSPRFESLKEIRYLKSLGEDKVEVVIATDSDSTGDLIALEILSLIPNSKRLNIPFDNLLKFREMNTERLKIYTDNLFNVDTASLYIREITKSSNIYERKLNVFSELIQNNITSIIIPKG